MLKWVSFLFFFGLGVFTYAQDSALSVLLKRHVETLANDSMQGRMTGRAGCHKAAAYIRSEMQKIDLKSFPDPEADFLIPYPFEVGKVSSTGYNVAGFIPSEKVNDSLIIFSAHYDHLGTTSTLKAVGSRMAMRRTRGDSIFNGANDNASGVAAMLALAAYFKNQPPPHFNLVFVAFSGEELGMLGSQAFVKKMDDPGLIVLNINLEMLGRPLKNDPFVFEPGEYSAFRDQLNENLRHKDPSYPKNYFSKDPYFEENLFQRSDHYSFYQRLVPAYTIMGSSPKDRYYHTADDEVETLDFPAMTKMVEAIKLAVEPFTKGVLKD